MLRNLVCFALLLAAGVLRAAGNPDDARLRDTLRSTMQALNAAQNDKQALLTSQAEDQKQIQSLGAQVKSLIKRSMEDKADAEKATAALSSRLAEQDREIARLKDALSKSDATNQKAAEALKQAEQVQSKMSADGLALQRHIDELKTRNQALFKLGNEILTRYEKYGLGDVMRAKEPFIGQARVKLENQVQDYEDKLLDQRATP